MAPEGHGPRSAGDAHIRLSVLVCTLRRRAEKFRALRRKLLTQMEGRPAELLWERDDGERTVGAKRNALVARARGDYICFVDDDDDVSPDYVQRILRAVRSNPDCVGISGLLLQEGRRPRKFVHSRVYEAYVDGRPYLRPPNHLNPVRRDLVLPFRFAERDFGEDTDWAMRVSAARVLTREVVVPEAIYYYRFRATDSATVARRHRTRLRRAVCEFVTRLSRLRAGNR